MDGFIYLFDRQGVFKWKRLIGSYVTNVRILPDRVVAVSDRQVYTLDLDGTVRRNLNISGFIHSSTITDDYIVTGMDDGVVYAHNLSGDLMWNHRVGSQVGSMVGAENITIGSADGQLIHFSGEGDVIFKRNLTDSIVSVESIGDYILAGTRDNKVHLYNSMGGLRWYYGTEGRPIVLSIQDRNILSGTTTGRVYYSKLPRRDVMLSFMLSAAIILLVGAAILVVSKSWK
jgi:outer membrane protein assembly factor BamB